MAIKSIKLKEKELEIDLTGPNGNAFYLIGTARNLGKQLGYTKGMLSKLTEELQSSDYENLVKVFDIHFGQYITLYR